MPLKKQTLISEIRKIADQQFVNFEQFPKNNIETAERWAEAIDTYANVVIPTSKSSGEARESFVGVMQQVTPGIDGLAILTQAILSYATILGAGMAPTFAGTPSPSPLVLSSVSIIGMSGGTSQQCCELLGSLIDTWFRSGIAINTTTGASVNWI